MLKSLDATPFPIALVDIEGDKIESWSSSALTQFGHTAPTAAEWYAIAYPDPDYRREVIERWKPALEKARHSPRAVNTGEYRVTCRDGSERVCELYAGFLADKLIVTFNDITERKRAEEEINSAYAFLDMVINMSPFAMWVSDTEGIVTSVNRSLCSAIGLTENDIVGKYNVLQDINLEKQDVMPMVKAVFAKHDPARFSIPWTAAGAGSADFQGAKNMYIDVSMFPILNAKEELIHVVCQWIDITERKQMEKTLRESEEKYRLIADNANDWIYLTAPDQTILFTSPACELVTGYTVGEFVNNPKLLVDIVHPDDRKDIERHLLDARGESETAAMEYRILTKSGETRWINHFCAPVRNDEGQFAGRRGTNRDITKRRRAEEALQKTLADLERSNTELEQFAYVASHDLQEPLRMVSSYTQLLGQRYKGKLDSDADEFIGYAVDGAVHMQRLINDLLAYSRVGTRGRPPAPVPADLALDRALDNLKLSLEEARAGVERGILPTVTVDDVQLIQVFQNLIANAIKFHGEAPPRVRIAAEARGKEWVFSVHDNGIGIDPQHLERIFIIFQRLNPRGLYPGTGIGLAICRKIIQRHGGRIWAESEPGKGSTFFFTLPRTGG